MARREEWRRKQLDADAIFFSHITHSRQLLHGRIETAAGKFGIAADAFDSIAGEIPEMLLVGGRGLAAQLHERALRRGRTGTGRDGCERGGCRSRSRDELPAIHISDGLYQTCSCRRRGPWRSARISEARSAA